MISQEFNWTKELEKTVVSSLVTSFGLDFLLFKDKKGGDIDTVHNARQGIYATEQERQRFENQQKYDSHQYHSHKMGLNLAIQETIKIILNMVEMIKRCIRMECCLIHIETKIWEEMKSGN